MLPDKALGVYLTTGCVTERLIVRMRVTRRPASGDNLITITGKLLKTMMPMRMMMIKAMTINVMPCRWPANVEEHRYQPTMIHLLPFNWNYCNYWSCDWPDMNAFFKDMFNCTSLYDLVWIYGYMCVCRCNNSKECSRNDSYEYCVWMLQKCILYRNESQINWYHPESTPLPPFFISITIS